MERGEGGDGVAGGQGETGEMLRMRAKNSVSWPTVTIAPYHSGAIDRPQILGTAKCSIGGIMTIGYAVIRAIVHPQDLQVSVVQDERQAEPQDEKFQKALKLISIAYRCTG